MFGITSLWSIFAVLMTTHLVCFNSAYIFLFIYIRGFQSLRLWVFTKTKLGKSPHLQPPYMSTKDHFTRFCQIPRSLWSYDYDI